MSDSHDLCRRRTILAHAIGQLLQLKREYLTSKHALRGLRGELLDVRRTRATIDFAYDGKWNVPIEQVLLPGSLEPDPRQLELFGDEEVAT